MRWLFVWLESLASGVLAVFAFLIILTVALRLYSRYVLGIGPDQTVFIGWDPVSLFGSYWKLALIGIPLGIFASGFTIAFWFFSKRVHR